MEDGERGLSFFFGGAVYDFDTFGDWAGCNFAVYGMGMCVCVVGLVGVVVGILLINYYCWSLGNEI